MYPSHIVGLVYDLQHKATGTLHVLMPLVSPPASNDKNIVQKMEFRQLDSLIPLEQTSGLYKELLHRTSRRSGLKNKLVRPVREGPFCELFDAVE